MRGFLRDFPSEPSSGRECFWLHLLSFSPGLLDKNSLNRCLFVSQHWATLAQQVKVDLSMHSFIQNQITLLQVLCGSERVVSGTSFVFILRLNLCVSRVDSKDGSYSYLQHSPVL